MEPHLDKWYRDLRWRYFTGKTLSQDDWHRLQTLAARRRIEGFPLRPWLALWPAAVIFGFMLGAAMSGLLTGRQ